jgi:hypothetical protein
VNVTPQKPRKRNLAAYNGRRFLGTIEITARKRRAAIVRAKDSAGKKLGKFKSQKAALRAIDAANAKRDSA